MCARSVTLDPDSFWDWRFINNLLTYLLSVLQLQRSTAISYATSAETCIRCRTPRIRPGASSGSRRTWPKTAASRWLVTSALVTRWNQRILGCVAGMTVENSHKIKNFCYLYLQLKWTRTLLRAGTADLENAGPEAWMRLWAYSAPPNLLTGLRRTYSKERGNGRENERKKVRGGKGGEKGRRGIGRGKGKERGKGTEGEGSGPPFTNSWIPPASCVSRSPSWWMSQNRKSWSPTTPTVQQIRSLFRRLYLATMPRKICKN